MKLNTEILEKRFQDFLEYLKINGNEVFKSFKESKYFDLREGYKESVYFDARELLGFQWWKPEQIGTGEIQKRVSSAIKNKVEHNGRMENNNLIDWRKKDDFSKRPVSKTLETKLFNLFKKVDHSLAFEDLLNEGLSYQFIAYLFFLKEKNKFVPLSQERFDSIFEKIGIPDFKTRNNASWENYEKFCAIIKQVQNFLKTKDKNTSLLDAHSFLWILGDQKEEKSQKPKTEIKPSNEKTEGLSIPEFTPSNATVLTSLQWTEILQNRNLTKDFDLEILRVLNSFEDHKTSAGGIGINLGIAFQVINSEIGRYAKRIAEEYPLRFTIRENGKEKYWDLFFNGWDEGSKFIWQLKPELIEALEVVGIEHTVIEEESIPEELPTENQEALFEGLKKTIVVNSYERNAKARQICIDYWGCVCAVCDFDFEEFYGEIGKDFIHVHHLKPIAEVGVEYQINPINDLIPVCPNCHLCCTSRRNLGIWINSNHK